MTAGARSAAIAGAILALPFALVYSLLVLHIQPPLGPLESLVTVGPDQPNVVGSAIVLGAWLLSVVALVVTSHPSSVTHELDAGSRRIRSTSRSPA